MKSTLIIPLLASLTVTGHGALLLTGGHIDAPAFGYVSAADVMADPMLTQGFEPHLHNEGGPSGAVVGGIVQTTESEYEPSEIIVAVPLTSTITVSGTNYYWLPEEETQASANGAPFLGIGLEELSAGDWLGGTVSLKLVSISGPGNFLLWQDDGLGGVTPFLAAVNDTMTLAAGSHTHFSWGFTEVGNYNLEFEISGTHVDDGFQTGSGVFTFQVPEPSSALLSGLGALALFRRRRA